MKKKPPTASPDAFETGHPLTSSRGLPSSIFKSSAVIDELVDHRLVAILFGVSARTLARWHLRGEGPPRISYGRSIKYRKVPLLDGCAFAKQLALGQGIKMNRLPSIEFRTVGQWPSRTARASDIAYA